MLRQRTVGPLHLPHHGQTVHEASGDLRLNTIVAPVQANIVLQIEPC